MARDTHASAHGLALFSRLAGHDTFSKGSLVWGIWSLGRQLTTSRSGM